MILVTGASGALGSLIHRRLAAEGGAEVVAGTRSPAGFTGPGPVRRIDFDAPDTLADGLAGVGVLVMVSAGFAQDDEVIARHGAVIDAAAAAGVRHVLYTSLAGSGERLSIALAHRWTEARLAAAPFGTTILRNGLYAQIPAGFTAGAADEARATGVFRAPLGDGHLPVVAREDLADAAARTAAQVHAALAAGLRSEHVGRIYELEGAEAVTGTDLADALADALAVPVRYEPAPLAGVWQDLAAAGLPPYQVAHSVSTFAHAGAGMLVPARDDLPALLGTAPRPVRDVIAGAIRPAL
jgi:NAD(P)H dehydrogenase (quinone)